MQFNWRITKYDPQYRNPEGHFTQEEWTSYADIGKLYNNKSLTYNDYLKTETLYINAIHYFINELAISSLQIIELERPNAIINDAHNTNEMITLFNDIRDNDWIKSDQIDTLCKLILREQIWCKLINDEKIYIHFGYDYYMYIGTILPCQNAITQIHYEGLFVEELKSPY